MTGVLLALPLFAAGFCRLICMRRIKEVHCGQACSESIDLTRDATKKEKAVAFEHAQKPTQSVLIAPKRLNNGASKFADSASGNN